MIGISCLLLLIGVWLLYFLRAVRKSGDEMAFLAMTHYGEKKPINDKIRTTEMSETVRKNLIENSP